MKGEQLLVVLGGLLISRLAWGESPSAREEADRLFAEGRALLSQGSVTLACTRFAHSYELLPRPGTELNLAVCLEQQGDNVAATRHFRRALAAAIKDARSDRQELAQKHLEGLKSKLAWITVRHDDETARSGVVVLADGGALALDDEQPFPLEPGTHTIAAQAPGHLTYQTQLVTMAGASYTVAIPVLNPLEPSAAPAPSSQRSIPSRLGHQVETATMTPAEARRRTAPAVTSARPVWGVALLGAGSVTAAVGAVFGIRAIQAGNDLEGICPRLTCTSDEALTRGRQLNADGETAALVANVALPVGALLGSIGTYLLATSKGSRADTASPSATPVASAPIFELRAQAGHGSAGAAVRTTW